jgi:CRP/FNR family cyclic AMP-dependent transcriptional regulator
MARTDEKIEHLGKAWLFSLCSKKDLQRISRASTEVVVPSGRVLTKEGALGQEFFLVLEGQVSVRKKGRKIAMLGPGEYFGELALLSHLPRNATCTSEEESTLLVLNQAEFSTIIEDVPSLPLKLLRAMAMRLREADAKASS